MGFRYFLIFVLCTHLSKGQDDYVKDDFLRYSDWIYKSTIKTVQLRESSYELASPVIKLNSNQQLELSFDDLDGGYKNYSYTLIHCDASWNPTDIPINDYIKGYFEESISNYEYSVNTVQKYTHYKLNFPVATMLPTKSGNYIIMVYENSEKENLVLTKRFQIYEELVTIAGNVHQAAGADDYFNKQEVDFSIFYSSYNLTNPFVDMKVLICQNNRWDKAISKLKPMFTKDKEFTFDFDDGSNCFDGLNEYRFCDFKTLKIYTQNIKKMHRDSLKLTHIELMPDEPKTFKKYAQLVDINGEFYIRNLEGYNGDTDADYCFVDFFLPYETTVTGGNVYVAGKFCDYRFSNTNRMEYDAQKKGYKCSLYLKQGYYNYQYVFVPDGKIADETVFEGNHWETENDYSVFVYHRSIGTNYDRLVGFKKLNSIRK